MKNSKHSDPDQALNVDPETGEILPETANIIEELIGNGRDGVQPDGTIFLKKITMATIRANPERCNLTHPPAPKKMALVTGIAGGEYLMPPMDDNGRLENLGANHPEYMTFCALVASLEPWGCVRFDDDGEPDAVFKSDYLFLPIGHISVIQKVRAVGQFAIATELWAQPADNRRKYSWYYHNLAKYDRGVSFIDRLLMHGVATGRALGEDARTIGLLADLRSR